jgi:hypothetical protein
MHDMEWHGMSRKGNERHGMSWNCKARHDMEWHGKDVIAPKFPTHAYMALALLLAYFSKAMLISSS